MNNFYFEIPRPSGPVRHAFLQLKPEDMAELAHLYPLPRTPDSPEDMVFDAGVVNPSATNRHDLNTWYRPNGVHRWGLFRGLVSKPIADQISTGELSFSVTLGLQIDDDPSHDIREAMLVYSVYDVAYGDVCLVTLVDYRFQKMRGAISIFTPSLHTLWSWDDICSDFSDRSGVSVIVPEPFELELGAADIVSPLIESRAAYVPADLIGGSTCRVPCFTRNGEIKYIKYSSLAALPTPGYQLLAAPTTYIFHGRLWSKLPTSADETKRFPSFRPACGHNEVGEESGYCYRDFRSPPVYVNVVSPSDYASIPLGGGTHHVTTYVRSLGGFFEDFPVGFRNFCCVQFTKLFKAAYYRRFSGLVDISPDTGADVIWRVSSNVVETIVSFDPWNYFPRAMCNFFGEAYPEIIHTPTGVDLKDTLTPTPTEINGSNKITISNSVLSGVPSDALYTLDHASFGKSGIVNTEDQYLGAGTKTVNALSISRFARTPPTPVIRQTISPFFPYSEDDVGILVAKYDSAFGVYRHAAIRAKEVRLADSAIADPLSAGIVLRGSSDITGAPRGLLYLDLPSLYGDIDGPSYGGPAPVEFSGPLYGSGITVSAGAFRASDKYYIGSIPGASGTDPVGNQFNGGICTSIGTSGGGGPPSGPAGGDLTGTYPNPSIANNAVTTPKIEDNAVTYSKMQNVTGERLLGNPNPTTGAVTEIPLGAGLAFMGGALVATGGGPPPPPPPPPPPQNLTQRWIHFATNGNGPPPTILSTNGCGLEFLGPLTYRVTYAATLGPPAVFITPAFLARANITFSSTTFVEFNIILNMPADQPAVSVLILGF